MPQWLQVYLLRGFKWGGESGGDNLCLINASSHVSETSGLHRTNYFPLDKIGGVILDQCSGYQAVNSNL